MPEPLKAAGWPCDENLIELIRRTQKPHSDEADSNAGPRAALQAVMVIGI